MIYKLLVVISIVGIFAGAAVSLQRPVDITPVEQSPAPQEEVAKISSQPEEEFSIATTTSPVAPPYQGGDTRGGNKEPQDKPDESKILAEISKNITTAKKQLENIQIPTPSSEPIPQRLPQNALYKIGSDSVVNFFCQRSGHTIIATGIIIDPRGYVLTNAHISDDAGEPTCLLRRGSPAENYALAKRVFTAPGFSPTVLEPDNLRKDVAIWKITGLVGTSMPASFPAITIDPNVTVTIGSPLSTFSYPAELLGSQAILRALYLTFSETHVTAKDSYFIESAQGLGSQKGSSGGVLIDPYTGKFAGLIFAVSDEDATSVSSRKLLSLTPFAIDQVVKNATGKNWNDYLSTVLIP